MVEFVKKINVDEDFSLALSMSINKHFWTSIDEKI